MLSRHLSRPGYRLAFASVLFCSVVIALGAFTRLVDAGLGCPDWPLCYGHLWAPMTEVDIEAANEAWPDFPVDHSITWPEMVHRYVATILGFMVLGIWWVTFRNRHLPGQPIKLPIIIGLVIIVQAAFGAWTVTLKLWPQVVTAHLLGGFTTFTLLWLLTLRYSGWQPRQLIQTRGLNMKLGILVLIMTVIQVALGGWLSSNYAALACPDFPTCQGYWFYPYGYDVGFDFNQQVGPNYLGGKLDVEGRAAIHYVHRVGALILTVLTLMFAWQAVRAGLRQLAGIMVGLLAIQVALGIINVLYAIPLWAATAHNGFAALFLLSVVTLLYRIYREVSYGK